MSERRVSIRGRGMAASCCAQLLAAQADGGLVAVTAAGAGIVGPKRAGLLAILLSASTQKLLADVFQSDALFVGLPEIRKRVVAWRAAEPIVVPHSAVVVPEDVLLERLRARIAGAGQRAVLADGTTVDWTIVTARDPGVSGDEMRFGSRMALVTEVELSPEAERDACWVEAVEHGWLFLLGVGGGKGSLICVGGPVEALLAKSRLVARQMLERRGTAVEFAAYPRMATSLCGAGWLGCGSAAMTFDPLCGEGAGNAVREAILACAAVRAIARGESEADVLGEYSLRLRLGFLRHLENCREFYQRDGANEFWILELDSIDRGIAWTREKLRGAERARFRLVGFELERSEAERV
jgi:hypothetical protein